MLYLIGNGPSQKDIDWEEYKDKEWWGFNAVSLNTVKPDLLFAIDIEVQAGIVEQEYYKTNKVAFAEFDAVPIEMWDMMKMGIGEYEKFHEIRKDGDTEFSVQGSYDGKECFFIGINGDYGNNIVMYNNPKLKNLFGGMSALGYAIENGYKDICLIGFDALEYNDPSNVFSESGLYKYKVDYTEDDRVFQTQQQQFLALLREYENINVYWKKPLDGLVKIDYNVLNYENSEKWILGVGHPSEVSL